MIVVGDASALIALHRVGGWDLLPRLYGEVHVPESVWQEVFSVPAFAARMPSAPGWLLRHASPVAAPHSPDLDALDTGEADAIRLAHSLPADLLLIDEVRGRRVAQRLGLRITGVVGLLIEAKRRGLIPSLAAALAKLKAQDFWMSDRLVQEALRLGGESEGGPQQ
ncbi:MAG: DUF3368 domain-containing protein [Verrucomicrobia bacterium]|nr:DUF3368 domain-containing protein [Verrucomicrobiota bacterium]